MQGSLIFVIFVTFCGQSCQFSTPESMTYEAGVVEFAYNYDPSLSSDQLLESNLQRYLEIMKNATTTLDIIVFPEATLNNLETAVEVPEAKDNIVPCSDPTYAKGNLVKLISCSANTSGRYVVVNIVSKAKCPDAEMIANKDKRSCRDRSDGFSYYNTNVVFNRKGAVVARYRKFNLFFEEVDKPSKPELVTFDTDFGVRFGTFICFDLIFRWPATEILFHSNVTDIVYSSMWHSELPFGTSVQVQQGFAYFENINLLAAGVNLPDVGSTGSGIYAGRRGPLVSAMHGSTTTQLYIATVPKVAHHNKFPKYSGSIKQTVDQMKPLNTSSEDLSSYNITFLSDQQIISEEICYGEICCTFDIKFSIVGSRELPHYKYAMAVFNGNRTFQEQTYGGFIACAIIACQSVDITTCGTRNISLASSYIFHSINIHGNFPIDGPKYMYMPSTLDTSIMPLNEDKAVFTTEPAYYSGRHRISASINTTSEFLTNILTFGICGRNFNLDSYQGESGAANLNISILLLTLLLIVSVSRR